MLEINTVVDKQYLLIYLIGDLTANNKNKYNLEVNKLISDIKARNIIFKTEYLNNIDEVGLFEILNTYNSILNN